MKFINAKQLSIQELSELTPFKQSKKLLVEKLTELGLPTRKSEAYRYFEVEPLLRETYESRDFISPQKG